MNAKKQTAQEAVYIIFDEIQLKFDAPNVDEAVATLERLVKDHLEVKVPRIR